MIATTQQKVTFNEFIEICPEDGVYELVNGEIVKMATTRNHHDVAEFADRQFYQEGERPKLNYLVKRGITIKTTTKEGSRRVCRHKKFSTKNRQSPSDAPDKIVMVRWCVRPECFNHYSMISS